MISRSIDGQLRRQGVDGHDREDIRHDVALAALDAWLGGRIATSLEGWCSVVARNAAKRRGALRGRDEALEAADSLQARIASVEDLVEHRLEAAALGRVWPQLSPTEQSLLIAAKPLSADPTSRNRHYVALHRARKRARALMEAATLAWLALLLAWRRREGTPVVQRVASLGMASVAVIAMSVAGERPLAGDVPHPSGRHVDASVAVPAPALSAHAASVSAQDAATSLASPVAVPTPRTPLRSPVEHREEIQLPGNSAIGGGVWNGDPSGEPLACVIAPQVHVRRCVETP